jgi:hypothetical protein
MVSLDAGVARQVAVTFDLSAMAGIAGFWISDLSLVPYYGVYIFLCHLNPAIGGRVKIWFLGVVARKQPGRREVLIFHDRRTRAAMEVAGDKRALEGERRLTIRTC